MTIILIADSEDNDLLKDLQELFVKIRGGVYGTRRTPVEIMQDTITGMNSFASSFHNDITIIKEQLENWEYSEDSYRPQYGQQGLLWRYTPKITHDLIAKLSPTGIKIIQFCRKCFMQLREFVNFRFGDRR